MPSVWPRAGNCFRSPTSFCSGATGTDPRSPANPSSSRRVRGERWSRARRRKTRPMGLRRTARNGTPGIPKGTHAGCRHPRHPHPPGRRVAVRDAVPGARGDQPRGARARLGRAAGAAPGSGDHTGSGREGRPSPPSLAGSEPAPTGARPPHGSQQAPSGGRAAAPPGTRRRSDQGRCRATAGSARGKKQHNELATREQRYLVSHVRCPFAPPLPTRGAMA